MDSESVGAFVKVLLAALIGVPLAAFFLQERLIFYPQPASEAGAADVRVRFPRAQDVFAQAADGTRLHAWHLPAAAGAPLVLYFGGNAEEVSWMLGEAGREAPRVAWLFTDYRGYGGSDGTPTETALSADALLWYDLAKARFAPAKILVLGRSLGSALAVHVAAERAVDGAILVTPFDSMVAVGKRHYPYLPVNWLLRHRFESVTRAPRVEVPLLCIVAARDRIIPPEHARRLYDAWAGPKRWVALEEADHNSTDMHPLYWHSISAFLNERSR